MPWTKDNPPRPAKNWSPTAKALCARVANAVLKESGNEQQAIFACIHAVRVKYPGQIKGSKKSEAELEAAAQKWFDTLSRSQLEELERNNPGVIEVQFEPLKSKTRGSLSDSAFAIVYTKPDGTKIRALPHHTPSGGVDLSHLRNALARVNQVKGVPASVKRTALRHLEGHARKVGVGDRKSAEEFVSQFYSLENITFEDGDENRNMTRGMVLAVAGKFVHPFFGEVNLEDTVLNELKRNFDKGVLGTDVAVDERHDRGRAMGWIRGVKRSKANLKGKDYSALVGDIEWTSEGRKLLEEKIYKYFSPEFGNFTEPDGKKTHENVLLGGALTNRPFLKMLPSVKFEEGIASDVIRFDEDPTDEDKAWEYVDNDKAYAFSRDLHIFDLELEDDDEVKLEDLLAEISKGLDGSVKFETQDALLAALRDGILAKQNEEKLKEKLRAAGIQFDDKTPIAEVVGSVITTQNSTIANLSSKVDEISKTFETEKRDRAVSELVRSGKIVPADKAEWEQLYDKDVKLFESMSTKLKPVVILGEIGGLGHSVVPGENVEFSDYDKAAEKSREYLKSMGITPKSEAKAGSR